MRRLVGFFGHSLVVEIRCRFWVEGEVELILPAGFKVRPTERIIPFVCKRVALGRVGRVGSDFVGDDTGFNIVAIRNPQVLFRCHVAQHGAAVPTNHHGLDP